MTKRFGSANNHELNLYRGIIIEIEMKRARKSYAELAKILGVSGSYLGRVINDRRGQKEEFLEIVCHEIGLSRARLEELAIGVKQVYDGLNVAPHLAQPASSNALETFAKTFELEGVLMEGEPTVIGKTMKSYPIQLGAKKLWLLCPVNHDPGKFLAALQELNKLAHS